MTTAHAAGPAHVDPELLGVYLEGHASPDEAAEVTAHLARCDECYELFVECARELNVTAAVAPRPVPLAGVPGGPLQSSPATPVPPARRPSWWMWAGAAAAAAVAALGTWTLVGLRSQEPRTSAAYVELMAALAPDRVVTGRLAGGVPYAPPPDDVRGGPGLAAARPDLRVQAAAARVQHALSGDQRPQARAALGTAYLVGGQLAEAITELEQAVADRPSDAEAENDLAVAYLERARQTRAPNDYERARAAAAAAARLRPAMPEAFFNQALALEGLGRRDEAAAAWTAFVALDPRSPWTAEAKARLAALSH
jgi:Flp pilus assembly protein TadD